MHPHLTPVDLAKAYRLLNHGPTVLVSARHASVDNVMAAAWCCALDFAPPKLTVVLDKATRTRELLEGSGRFVIQVPTVAQLRLTEQVGNHSLKDDPDKLAKAGVELFAQLVLQVPAHGAGGGHPQHGDPWQQCPRERAREAVVGAGRCHGGQALVLSL